MVRNKTKDRPYVKPNFNAILPRMDFPFPLNVIKAHEMTFEEKMILGTLESTLVVNGSICISNERIAKYFGNCCSKESIAKALRHLERLGYLKIGYEDPLNKCGQCIALGSNIE